MQGVRVGLQSGSDADCRGNFTSSGQLSAQDDHSRPISDGLTVFALAYELYNISVTPAPVVWAIGYTTDLVINYTDLSGAPPTPRTPFYKTRYSNDEEMVSTYSNPWVANTSKSKHRWLTSSTTSAMRPQEHNSWTERYSRMPILLRNLFQT